MTLEFLFRLDGLKTDQWAVSELCNQVGPYKSKAGRTLQPFVLGYLKRLLQHPEMATKVKIEQEEEEVKPSTSGEGASTQEPEKKSEKEE